MKERGGQHVDIAVLRKNKVAGLSAENDSVRTSKSICRYNVQPENKVSR